MNGRHKDFHGLISGPFPIGQWLALLCWVVVAILSYAAWRRRRRDSPTTLLIVSGTGLIARLAVLMIDPLGTARSGTDWLAAALDVTGLVVLAWPLLAPPLPPRWADRIAGAGLMLAALGCGQAVWQWIRASVGLPPAAQFTILWSDVALVTAGLAALNLFRQCRCRFRLREIRARVSHILDQSPNQARERLWLLTTVGALLASSVGMLLSGSTSGSSSGRWSPLLTAVATVVAATWLNWLERPQPEEMPTTLRYERDSAAHLHLLELTPSLFTAPNPAQILKIATEKLRQSVGIQQTALFLTASETNSQPNSGNGNDPIKLRLVARWPQSGSTSVPSSPSELLLAQRDAIVQGRTVHVTSEADETDEHRLKRLNRVLQAELKSALCLPLFAPSAPQRLMGLLVLGHDNASLSPKQRQLCRAWADQVAISVEHVRLRDKTNHQAGELARLSRHQEQETGQLHAILESIADGVIVSDAADQVVLINDAALAILNVERSDVVGQPFGQIMAHMAPTGEIGIIGTLTETSPYSITAVFQTSDRIVQTSMTPVENYAGAQMGVVAVLRDITALAEAEVEREQLLTDLQEHSRQLEEATQRLQELDQLKSQFIVNMSHELRTPLNHIIGFSGVMLKEIDGPITEAQRQDLNAIHTSGKHLLGLITDILDVSQIWAGKMELALDEVDLPKTIADAVAIAVPLIGDKPIELTQALDPDLPAIQADEKRVRQILINLLTNAIKYTERGQVTVSASHADGHVVIGVSDTGIGIPPEYQETIFEEFSRVDSSSTRKVDGLGLGLSISRRLVELHGGQIWVKSEPDVGSTFYFTLPVDGPAE